MANGEWVRRKASKTREIGKSEERFSHSRPHDLTHEAGDRFSHSRSNALTPSRSKRGVLLLPEPSPALAPAESGFCETESGKGEAELFRCAVRHPPERYFR
jgi:hypothetical protein